MKTKNNKPNNIFYIPENLNLEEILANNQQSAWLTDTKISKLLYIIKTIYYLRSAQRLKNAFVNLKAKYLMNVIGWRFYRKALDVLLACGVIEADHHYIRGRKSKGYKLNQKYAGPSKPVVIKDQKLLLRMQKADKHSIKTAIGQDVNRQYIWDNLQHVTIAPAAEKTIASLYFDNEDNKAVCQMTVAWINRHDLFFCCDPNTKRLYNNITNLKQEVRKHILIDQEPTVEIDLRNSQPMFLSAFYGSDDGPEKHLYDQQVSQGVFYDFINERMPRPVDLDDPAQKKKLKGQCFAQIFFGHNHSPFARPAWDIFAANFPILANIITDIKRDDFTRLAYELQKKEAEIVIGQIVNRCRLSGIKVLTVHDSVIVQEKHRDFVQPIMLEEIEKVVGFVPQLQTVAATTTTCPVEAGFSQLEDENAAPPPVCL